MAKITGKPPENVIPEITDTPPENIVADLENLRTELDASIPRKILDHNVLIATWNIRAFGNLTKKWISEEGDSPKRDFHSLLCIAEIIKRFDVVAIQEIKGNLRCLRYLLDYLGPNWGLILTDVTAGREGNDERLGFVFDKRKVNISGLACELVVPQEKLDKIHKNALTKQFARTPYAVAFRSEDKTFILVTLHVIYGKRAKQRLPELQAIADWLCEWAQDVNAYDQNLIALGDFNIDRSGDKLYQAFVSSGLSVPSDMNRAKRTVFSDPNTPDQDKFYDQIAWFRGKDKTRALSLTYKQGGYFDFVGKLLKDRNLELGDLTWHISDHYPLWAEFRLHKEPKKPATRRIRQVREGAPLPE